MFKTPRTVSLLARVLAVVTGAGLVCLGVASPAFANGKDREFAGYLVHKTGKLYAASATFTVPTTTCGSNQIAFGPGVFLQRQSLDAQTVQNSGAYELVDCESPGVAGSLYIELRINGEDSKYLTAMPNDVVHVSVRRKAKTITVIATDKTAKTTATAKGKVSKGQSYAVFGDYLPETVAWAKARNTVTTFTAAWVNRVKLGHAHPVAYNCVRGKKVQYKPSAITGAENFTINFLHH
jgi:hypothetical protein